MLLMAVFAIFAANLRADSGANRNAGTVSHNFPAIIFVQTPRIVGVTGADRFPEGSRIVLLAPDPKNKWPRVLTESFFAAADPQVDFVGKRVLFAAQKARGDHWQIWEMNLDGSGVRQITKCASDCLRPAYLPADEIVFTSVSTESGSRQSSLEVTGLDGSNVHAITFGPGAWWLETVLRDGRIVASANAPLAESVASTDTNRLLYTLRPDGTGLESLRCEHHAKALRGEASELEDGSIIFTKNGDELALIRRGALHEEGLGEVGPHYRSPGRAQGDAVMVARKTVSNQRYQLTFVSRNGGGEARTIYSDPKLDSLEPVAVIPRPVPKKFWSTLVPSSSAGFFISLDSSNSMDKTQGAAAIRRVRVIEQTPLGPAVLGEAAVETDGSFYVQTPANQPVRFALLDEHGNVIREERSWIWTRPGEQRGCTGCHGDKALAPENRWPMALKRKDPPTNLSSTATSGEAESHGH